MELTHEQKIKAITDAYLESLLVDLPSEEELAGQQVLSDRFLHRMDRLVRQDQRLQKKQDHVFTQITGAEAETSVKTPAGTAARKPIRLNSRFKKRLLIAVILFTILASAAGVSASREAIVGFVVQVFERFSTVVFNTPTETMGSTQNPYASNDLSAREPSVIPTGYHQTEQALFINFWQIVYANETGQEIIYMQQDKSNTQLILDTEGIQIEELSVNGYKAIFYTQKGLSSIIWEDERYAYTISGAIAKSDIIRMANSTLE